MSKTEQDVMSKEEVQKNLAEPADSCSTDVSMGRVVVDDGEIFARSDSAVDFRTVGWVRPSTIFLKVIFATGVLSIPSTMYTLGAFPGAVNVIGWGALNTYTAIVQGRFRMNHPGCYTIADMAGVVGGPVLREIVGFLYIISFVLSGSSGIIGVSTALNALSVHALCTVWFSAIATVMVILCASVRKLEHIGWLTWAGFTSVFVGVTIVVIAVTIPDRPAAAPQTGPFDLGYRVIGNPTFAQGMSAVMTIYDSSAGTPAFIPVISEMKRPQDFNKAVYLCMGLSNAAYLAYSLVVYRWCGKWVASPSLGSAGPTIKKVSYGIAILGLVVSGCIYVHVAAKFVFVRILRNSRHLQQNSFVHWFTWIGSTVTCGIIAFLLAEGIPIFNYVLALLGSVCFAPLSVGLPAYFWLYDNPKHRTGTIKQRLFYYFHCFLILLASFLSIGGTYGTVVEIINAYSDSAVTSAFSCADNSGSV